MKKSLLFLFLLLIGWNSAISQLPNGSVAPNFTVTDIDGNTHNLYQLLDQGKTVYLDFFATWCGPCWNYHNTHAFRDVWETYGPSGTNEAFVMSIEGDPATNHACLYGPTGCVGGTQGDWTDGVPYPIVESPAVRSMYAVTYYPTIYMVCPADKKVYEVGQLPMSGLWAQRDNLCPPLVVNMTVNNVNSVKCYGSNTGSIDISVSGGLPPYTYNWSNGAHSQDLVNVPAGTYTCSVTSSNGWPGVTDPITVEGPAEPLTVSIVEQTPVGCNGIQGTVTVDGEGGWPGDYIYFWSNGQTGEFAYGLNPGNYTVSVTDAGACTKTLTVNFQPPAYPVAAIAPPSSISCAQPSVQIDGSGSSSGPDFTYQWFAANGGNIVSGVNTLMPVVNAAGTYTLQITNNSNSCISYASVSVSANTTTPTANAGPPAEVSCVQPTTVLQGSGSAGANISYLWTASNGGNITAGGNTLTPTAGAAGTYTLQVTNTTNGCTAASSTTVTGQNTPPTVSTVNDTLTCLVAEVTLTTSTNSNNATFAWTGPNGYTSNVQSPTVTVSGTYNVVVSDTLSGCNNSATANVTADTENPGASATGGSLTCVVNSVTLNGSSPAEDPVYAWTGPNGYTSNLQNPVVSEAGQYTLLVTDPGNGCTSTANATVALNNTPPTASASTPGNLNCNASQIQLNGSGSSQGPDFTYLWSTANGNIVSGENTLTPLVNQVGTYNLLVTNSTSGCTSTTSTTVAQSPAVTAAISAQTNVSCNGASNGTAAVAPGGGNGTYTYIWSNGAATASISNLAAGAYLVTVTDGENCTASTSVNITQPDPLAANASATAQSANGVNDGTATATPTGGVSTYSYVWSNGAATQTINSLAPGNYTVTVTDANGCTAIQTVTVNSFNCAMSASISGENVTCFGANNGSATVSLVGAADPIAYAWSNGATTQSVSGLAPGVYTVEITDGNNCPAELNITIVEPAQLLANATATHENAAGANDGTATANPTGGANGYEYLWSNGAENQTISNLAPGTYTVTVTDANNCTSVQSVVVNAFNCAFDVQSSISNVTCAGAANGSITLAPAGGAAPFTYAWSNGGNTPTVSGLEGGNYTASITDANGCQVIISAAVSEPAPYSSWTIETVNPACPNEASGTATASITGGTTPYNFLWSNGQNTNMAVNLTAGTYGVTVTDANGCQSSSTAIITASDNIPPAVSVQNATLPLNSAGLAEVTLSALSAQLSDNCGVASSSILPNSFNCTELGQHEVTVTVTDQSGLTATATATVTVVDNLAPVVTCPANVARCAGDNIVEYNSPVAEDNCLSSGGEWKLESGLESGSAFPPGITTQTYSYTDASGNKGACSFEVNITEAVVLNNVAVTHDVNNQGVGAIDITVVGGTAPYTFKWSKDGQNIADTEDLSSLTEGDYSVVVTDVNGCVVSTENIHVSNTTATHEPSWLSGVRLQPNPTSGFVRVVFNQAVAASMEISVTDADGRVLLTGINDNQFVVTLDCANLPDGIYFVRFRSGEEVGMRKLVVSR